MIWKVPFPLSYVRMDVSFEHLRPVILFQKIV